MAINLNIPDHSLTEATNARINPLLLAMEALQNVTNVGDEQEFTDAKTAELDVTIANALNTEWEGGITEELKAIHDLIASAPLDKNGKPKLSAQDEALLQEYQAQLNHYQSQQQTANTETTGITQAQQNQVSNDANNLSQAVRAVGQSINSVMQTLNQLMGGI